LALSAAPGEQPTGRNDRSNRRQVTHGQPMPRTEHQQRRSLDRPVDYRPERCDDDKQARHNMAQSDNHKMVTKASLAEFLADL